MSFLKKKIIVVIITAAAAMWAVFCYFYDQFSFIHYLSSSHHSCHNSEQHQCSTRENFKTRRNFGCCIKTRLSLLLFVSICDFLFLFLSVFSVPSLFEDKEFQVKTALLNGKDWSLNTSGSLLTTANMVDEEVGVERKLIGETCGRWNCSHCVLVESAHDIGSVVSCVSCTSVGVQGVDVVHAL